MLALGIRPLGVLVQMAQVEAGAVLEKQMMVLQQDQVDPGILVLHHRERRLAIPVVVLAAAVAVNPPQQEIFILELQGEVQLQLEQAGAVVADQDCETQIRLAAVVVGQAVDEAVQEMLDLLAIQVAPQRLLQ
jgi:hypothetical protein